MLCNQKIIIKAMLLFCTSTFFSGGMVCLVTTVSLNKNEEMRIHEYLPGLWSSLILAHELLFAKSKAARLTEAKSFMLCT